MAFKSQSECPKCGGQLNINYQTMKVECEYCGSTFTIEEISQYINGQRSNQLETSEDEIYNKEKYNEVLTTKSIENLKDDALKQRMKMALVTERYNELSQYIKELLRREPDNCLGYEYSLMMKYKVFRLEELADIDEPFYEDSQYRILYRIADQFKRAELDDIKQKAIARKEERQKAAAAEREKLQAEFRAQERKVQAKSRASSALCNVLGIIPLVMVVIMWILLIASFNVLRVSSASIGGYIFLVLLFTAAGVGVGVFTIKKGKDGEQDDKSTKIFFIVDIVFAIAAAIFIGVRSAKVRPGYNPAEHIEIQATSFSDDTSYSGYETTVYFTIHNNTPYEIEGFNCEMSFYRNGSSLGSWTVNFSGNYPSNYAKNVSVTFTSSSSALYDSTYSETSIKYKISSIRNKNYQDVEFSSSEKYCSK